MTDVSHQSHDSTPEPREKTEVPRKGTIMKNPWFWVGACAVCAAGSGIAINQVAQTYFSPEYQVARYFDVLESGHSDKALGMLKAKIPSGDAVLLSGEPFKKTLEGLDTSNLSLEASRSSSNEERAVVTATYAMNGAQRQTQFGLQKTKTDWLFFDHWEFVPVALPTATVQAQYSSQATVNGSGSPLSLEGPSTSEAGPAWNVQKYPVLPPAQVRASYETEFVKGAEQQQLITQFNNAKQKPIALGAEASDKLADYVDAQLKKYLDECATQQVLKPTGCPMNYDTNARVRSASIKWEILEYPEAKVTLTPQGWNVERLSGRAKIALEEQDLDTGERSDVQAEDPFDFSATVSVQGNNVTVTPDAFDYDPNNKT